MSTVSAGMVMIYEYGICECITYDGSTSTPDIVNHTDNDRNLTFRRVFETFLWRSLMNVQLRIFGNISSNINGKHQKQWRDRAAELSVSSNAQASYEGAHRFMQYSCNPARSADFESRTPQLKTLSINHLTQILHINSAVIFAKESKEINK